MIAYKHMYVRTPPVAKMHQSHKYSIYNSPYALHKGTTLPPSTIILSRFVPLG